MIVIYIYIRSGFSFMAERKTLAVYSYFGLVIHICHGERQECEYVADKNHDQNGTMIVSSFTPRAKAVV